MSILIHSSHHRVGTLALIAMIVLGATTPSGLHAVEPGAVTSDITQFYMYQIMIYPGHVDEFYRSYVKGAAHPYVTVGRSSAGNYFASGGYNNFSWGNSPAFNSGTGNFVYTTGYQQFDTPIAGQQWVFDAPGNHFEGYCTSTYRLVNNTTVPQVVNVTLDGSMLGGYQAHFLDAIMPSGMSFTASIPAGVGAYRSYGVDRNISRWWKNIILK